MRVLVKVIAKIPPAPRLAPNRLSASIPAVRVLSIDKDFAPAKKLFIDGMEL